MPCGVRVLTFFLYLNDVEEGGGTRFNRLNFAVKPKSVLENLSREILLCCPRLFFARRFVFLTSNLFLVVLQSRKSSTVVQRQER